jgi:hypothetical protein
MFLIAISFVGPNWLTANFCPTKIMASQNLGLPNSRLAKVTAKNIGMHLVDYHNNNGNELFSFMQSKNILETCQNFGHKYWCASSLAMNQLMTKNFGMPWFWLSNNWMPTTKARNFL